MGKANKAKRHKESRTGVKVIAALVLIVCIGAATYLGAQAYGELKERGEGTSYYSALSAAAQSGVSLTGEAKSPAGRADTQAAADPEGGQPADALLRSSEMDFGALKVTCPDVVGWIRCEGTKLDYPIVQGADNAFYLSHLADGTKNAAGSIMMDTACNADFSDDVTILHGHHMRSGDMFGDLDEYKSADYFAAHPVMRLYTPDGDFDVEVIAARTISIKTFSYPVVFSGEETFDAFVADMRVNSFIGSDVPVAYGDKLLLLSTCAYDFNDARFIVLGKIVS